MRSTRITSQIQHRPRQRVQRRQRSVARGFQTKAAENIGQSDDQHFVPELQSRRAITRHGEQRQKGSNAFGTSLWPLCFFFVGHSRQKSIDPPPVSHRLWKLADDEYSSGPRHRDGFFCWERISHHRKQSWTCIVVPTQRLWGAMMTQVLHCNKKKYNRRE